MVVGLLEREEGGGEGGVTITRVDAFNERSVHVTVYNNTPT